MRRFKEFTRVELCMLYREAKEYEWQMRKTWDYEKEEKEAYKKLLDEINEEFELRDDDED